MTLDAAKLIDSSDVQRPNVSCIEQYSLRTPVHYRIVSLQRSNRCLVVTITSCDVPTGMTFLLINAIGALTMLYELEEIKWHLLYEALTPGIKDSLRLL